MTAGPHTRPVTGDRGAVAAAHPAAVAAGTAVLERGGTALDAAVAAQAVVAVLMPHAAGLGGDLLALVRDRDGAVHAVNGCGRSPATAVTAAADGGAAVTVPGLVDGWARAHRRWGRLPLADLLDPAARLAADGHPAGPGLLAAVAAQRDRLLRGGAAGWPLLALTPGDRWRQPELAALLWAVGERGADAYYTGPVAAATAGAARRAGGALTVGDLAAHHGEIREPVTVGWDGGRLHVQPPPSQGVLLAMAARWLDRAGPPATDLDHLLVEVTEAAFEHRDDCGTGAALLDHPLAVDPDRAARRGGPRAYLHTAGVAAADATGQVVSSLISVFDDFGAAVYVPEGGFVLNNRAGGFTAGRNAFGPGRRPVHTLAPALVEDPAGAVLALATPGADGQVQTLLQLLARRRWAGLDLAAALAAPRWRSQDGALLVEDGHPAHAALAARGHDVRPVAPGGDLFGAVVAAGVGPTGPYAAADSRRDVRAGAA